MTGKVWFVGAGPGDPELLTVKGRRLLEGAGAILFAGSLVDRAATLFAPPGCEIRDSKDMTLEEMSAWLVEQSARHASVVRLQTGDPGLYGALIEMTRRSAPPASSGRWCRACRRPSRRRPPPAKP
jgi:precorrin-4/cobalt-precorrin-4 C11-methyltransferase